MNADPDPGSMQKTKIFPKTNCFLYQFYWFWPFLCRIICVLSTFTPFFSLFRDFQDPKHWPPYPLCHISGPVLPTNFKNFLLNQSKNSAAGEKVRPPHNIDWKWLILKFFQWIKIQSGKETYVNQFIGIVCRARNVDDFKKIQTWKKFGPFSALFWQIRQKFGPWLSRPRQFFFGPFFALRPKFRPLGNTAQVA
jgi:hypothetical protein